MSEINPRSRADFRQDSQGESAGAQRVLSDPRVSANDQKNAAHSPSNSTNGANQTVLGQSTIPPAAEVAPMMGLEAAEVFSFLAPPLASDELGRLGRYRILQVLGRGGMGIVFRAEDQQLQRHVALKILRPGKQENDTDVQRFLREARVMARVEHDHLISIYEVGEVRGVLYLTMPLLRGETLGQRLVRENHLAPRDVARLGRQIAEGLSALHAQGLIHRDLKPTNIWLESVPNRAKILDFGLVRRLDQETEFTAEGLLIGTPAYMAPEQARGETVTPQADLFSLGCVLYEAVSGQSPFKRSDILSTLRALELDEPAGLRTENSLVHPEFHALISKLLQKDPSHRPPGASDVAAELSRIESRLTNQTALPVRLTPSRATKAGGLTRKGFKVPLAIAAVALVAIIIGMGIKSLVWSKSKLNEFVQPGSQWTGTFSFVGMQYQGDVQVRITERHGHQIAGLYSTEEGAYQWRFAGTLDGQNIQWKFTEVVREKEPRSVVEKASVAGQINGKTMELIFHHAGNQAEAKLQLKWQE